MPSPEDESSHAEYHEPPYHRAARFSDERSAGRAYLRAQDAIFHTPNADLSVFRLHLSHAYHVAILGLEPPRPLRRLLERALATGEPVSLPQEAMEFLVERRIRATRLGSWVERHRRPLPEEGTP